MVVTEDKAVHLVILLKFHSKFIQRLLSTPEDIFFMAGEAIASRPAITKTEGNPRMQHAEKELQDTAVEHTTKETVTEWNRTQPVTMAQTEDTAIDFNQCRLFKALHTQFLKITICPHIVVSLEEIHLHSPVNKISNSAKHPDISFWNNIAILVPEVPNVTEKIQSLCFLR
jgi:hypothetical protein